MKKVKPSSANESILRAYAAELAAEQAYSHGDYVTAEKLQEFLDQCVINPEDKAWYLQEMARYYYRSNQMEFKQLQIAAHKANHFLLKPPSGVTVAKLTIVSQGRMERIIKWVHKYDTYASLDVTLSDILGRLAFGIQSDKFEQALNEISEALGFTGERPDKEWKEGPDNLWALDNINYILWECKNQVETTRSEINKREAEQMNRSSAWFEKHYPGFNVKRVIIHPAYVVESAANFIHDVEVMREKELKHFVNTIGRFFKSFELFDFKDLSESNIRTIE